MMAQIPGIGNGRGWGDHVRKSGKDLFFIYIENFFVRNSDIAYEIAVMSRQMSRYMSGYMSRYGRQMSF